MTSLDISDRYFRCQHLRQRDLDRLVDAGVPHEASYQPDSIAKSSVVFGSEYLFDFAEELYDPSGAGEAYIFVARNEFGDLWDLVAWQPKSGRLASWLGRASLLGGENVFRPRLSANGGIVVHDSPLSWLCAKRTGIVILHAGRAAGLLCDVGPLIVSDRARAGRLRTSLTRKPPRILVAPQNVARAA
jgi:hypothetical protein